MSIVYTHPFPTNWNPLDSLVDLQRELSPPRDWVPHLPVFTGAYTPTDVLLDKENREKRRCRIGKVRLKGNRANA